MDAGLKIGTTARAGVAEFIVVQGRGAASGRGEYAEVGGSIQAQIPHFERLGLSLRSFHPATINADIGPVTWTMVRPLFSARNVRWLPGFPGEDFDFATAAIEMSARLVPALVYYPRPETKGHFAAPTSNSMIELLAPFIEGVECGSTGWLYINPDEIRLLAATGRRAREAAE